MASIDDLYEQLDGFWKSSAGEDDKLGLNFLVVFESKEVMEKALRGLSFIGFEDDGRMFLRQPEAEMIHPHLSHVKDLDVFSVMLVGRFTYDQARETILSFATHSAHGGASDEYLAKQAAAFAEGLQERGGGGGVIWVDWPELSARDRRGSRS